MYVFYEKMWRTFWYIYEIWEKATNMIIFCTFSRYCCLIFVFCPMIWYLLPPGYTILQQLISTLTFHFRIWKKATSIIKIVINELICNKKYLKAEKRFNTKESLQCFYIQVFVSVYKEIETIIQKCFWKNLFITSFWEV